MRKNFLKNTTRQVAIAKITSRPSFSIVEDEIRKGGFEDFSVNNSE